MKTKKLEKVYIVEDADIQREMLKDHLLSKNKNLKIKGYATGTACIKELVLGTAEEPDLVLMDYFLDSSFGASADGLESLTKLKEICPDTDVIMLTSVDNNKIMELARKKGALDYVVKSATGFNDLDTVLNKHFSLEN
jgi:DNA-binding NarL/FixJ family response regulator